jgi:hypothetical protein
MQVKPKIRLLRIMYLTIRAGKKCIRLTGYNLHDSLEHYNSNPTYLSGYISIAAHEYAVLFARHHREKQIEAIAKGLYEYFACDMGDQEEIEKIVENAYPEDRII